MARPLNRQRPSFSDFDPTDPEYVEFQTFMRSGKDYDLEQLEAYDPEEDQEDE